MPDPTGPNEFVSEAYRLEDETSLIEFYRKWAEDYDRQMHALGYVAPQMIAQLLGANLPDRESSIFDIGCGTGLTCEFLARKGYSNLDGIDISSDMVSVAAESGIYRELLVGDVNQALERDDDSYHGVISSGTFTHGHVGPEPLDEIFRILRPGGILACSVHQDLWESMGFRARFEALGDQGIATCVSLHRDKYYEAGEPEGWFCVYRKKAS